MLPVLLDETRYDAERLLDALPYHCINLLQFVDYLADKAVAFPLRASMADHLEYSTRRLHDIVPRNDTTRADLVELLNYFLNVLYAIHEERVVGLFGREACRLIFGRDLIAFRLYAYTELRTINLSLTEEVTLYAL